jgi:hypothetical protein
MTRLLSILRDLPPVVAVTRFSESHPRATAWLGLSTGACASLVVGGRDADLPLRSWLALFAASILTAGMCILIVGGDDGNGAPDDSTSRSGGVTGSGDESF